MTGAKPTAVPDPSVTIRIPLGELAGLPVAGRQPGATEVEGPPGASLPPAEVAALDSPEPRWWVAWLPIPLYVLVVGNQWVSERLGRLVGSDRTRVFAGALSFPHWWVRLGSGEYYFARSERPIAFVARLFVLLGLSAIVVWGNSRSANRRRWLVLVIGVMGAAATAGVVGSAVANWSRNSVDDYRAPLFLVVRGGIFAGSVVGLGLGAVVAGVARSRTLAVEGERRGLRPPTVERLALVLGAIALSMVFFGLIGTWVSATDSAAGQSFFEARRVYTQGFLGSRVTNLGWSYFAFGWVLHAIAMLAAVAVKRRNRVTRAAAALAMIGCGWQFYAATTFGSPTLRSLWGTFAGGVLALSWTIGRGRRAATPEARTQLNTAAAVPGATARVWRTALIAGVPLLIYTGAVGNGPVSDWIRFRGAILDWSGALLVPSWGTNRAFGNRVSSLRVQAVLLVVITTYLVAKSIRPSRRGVFVRCWVAVIASSAIASVLGCAVLVFRQRELSSSISWVTLLVFQCVGALTDGVLFGSVMGLLIATLAWTLSKPHSIRHDGGTGRVGSN